jgi:hypothetical protein
MRQYQRIFDTADGYKVVQTNRTRYVLDYTVNDIGTYAERRVMLLGDLDRPYELYPLNKRIESVSQILLSLSRGFIDSTGKLVTWKPSKFYPVICYPIDYSWTTPKGYTGIDVDGSKFIVSAGIYKYAQLVKVGRLNVLFDLCNERRPDTRKKI